MRKPLKIYLFFLLLITAFGVLGNILIQDEPNLEATDINTDIPGSAQMVAMYEPLADAFSEDRIIDIVVLPTDDAYDVELMLVANTADEAVLQEDTARAISLIADTATISHVQVQWQLEDANILTARFDAPLTAMTASDVVTRATSYTFTP